MQFDANGNPVFGDDMCLFGEHAAALLNSNNDNDDIFDEAPASSNHSRSSSISTEQNVHVTGIPITAARPSNEHVEAANEMVEGLNMVTSHMHAQGIRPEEILYVLDSFKTAYQRGAARLE